MICTLKVGLNNQLTKVQIFYDQIQHTFQTTIHRILSSKLERWINQFNHSGIAAKSNFLGADHIRAILYRQKSR